jgi:uncharacterized membrane protein
MLKQKISSRKFWVAVAGAVLIIANEGFGLGIPEDAYWQIVALVLGYVFGEAAVDIARAKVVQGGGQDAGK